MSSLSLSLSPERRALHECQRLAIALYGTTTRVTTGPTPRGMAALVVREDERVRGTVSANVAGALDALRREMEHEANMTTKDATP